MKSALINGVMGGVMGFHMSLLLNYFVFPLPESIRMHAIGNGLSGLMSGFMGGFIGVMIHIKTSSGGSR